MEAVLDNFSNAIHFILEEKKCYLFSKMNNILKVCIKEKYFSFQGDFLQNLRHIDFGIRHCGTTVGDVDLPPWAENHSDFVEKLSQAMESDYVSRYVHFFVFFKFFFVS